MILNAENFNPYHLGMVPVSYPPKNISTMALQVTEGNIGALSLECRTPIRYPADEPVLDLRVARATKDEPNRGPETIDVRSGSWIVILWDQLYVFREQEFKSTFLIGSPNPHALHEPLVDHDSLKELREFEKRIDLAQGREVLDEEIRGPFAPASVEDVPRETDLRRQ